MAVVACQGRAEETPAATPARAPGAPPPRGTRMTRSAPRPGPPPPLVRPVAGRVRAGLPDLLHDAPRDRRVRVRVQRDPVRQLRLPQRGPLRGRGGTSSGADCVILEQHRARHHAPRPTPGHVNTVEIYRAKSNGDAVPARREDDLQPDRLDDLHVPRRNDADGPVHPDRERLSRGQPLQHPRRLRRHPHVDRPHRGPHLLHAQRT